MERDHNNRVVPQATPVWGPSPLAGTFALFEMQQLMLDHLCRAMGIPKDVLEEES